MSVDLEVSVVHRGAQYCSMDIFWPPDICAPLKTFSFNAISLTEISAQIKPRIIAEIESKIKSNKSIKTRYAKAIGDNNYGTIVPQLFGKYATHSRRSYL